MQDCPISTRPLLLKDFIVSGHRTYRHLDSVRDGLKSSGAATHVHLVREAHVALQHQILSVNYF
jgi:hypothetical protein